MWIDEIKHHVSWPVTVLFRKFLISQAIVICHFFLISTQYFSNNVLINPIKRTDFQIIFGEYCGNISPTFQIILLLPQNIPSVFKQYFKHMLNVFVICWGRWITPSHIKFIPRMLFLKVYKFLLKYTIFKEMKPNIVIYTNTTLMETSRNFATHVGYFAFSLQIHCMFFQAMLMYYCDVTKTLYIVIILLIHPCLLYTSRCV